MITLTSLLLIETAGPSSEAEKGFLRDAVAQVRAGLPVTLLLLQDGVMLALPGLEPLLDEFCAAGGTVAGDRFSISQRGLVAEQLRPEVRITEMDEIAERVLDPGVRVVWH